MKLNSRPNLHRLPMGSRLGNLTPITPSIGIPTYQDVGAVNATSINVTGLSSYLNDGIYNVVIAHANTGNATFQINGFAPLPLITATGDQLIPGQLQPGMVATIETIGGNALLLNAFNAYSNQATVFTANGNYTPTVSGNYLIVLIGGGGGGGGGGGSTVALPGGGGKGGGGGALNIVIEALVAGTNYPVVIGTGGNGGPAGAAGGGDGNGGNDGTGTTWNGGQVVAAAGRGGTNGLGVGVEPVEGEGGTNGGGNGGGRGGVRSPQNAAGTNGESVVFYGGGGGGGSGAGNGTANAGGAGGNGAPGIAFVLRAS